MMAPQLITKPRWFLPPPPAAFYLLRSKESTPRSRKLAVKSFHFSCCSCLLKHNKSRRATFSSFLITKLTLCIFLCLLHAHTLWRTCFAVNWLVCHLGNTSSGIKKRGVLSFNLTLIVTWLKLQRETRCCYWTEVTGTFKKWLQGEGLTAFSQNDIQK